MIYFGMGPKKGADGKYIFTLPMADKKMAGIAAEDIGKCAYGILKREPSYIGKTVGIAGDQLTGDEMAGTLSAALDKEVVYNCVTPAQYRAFGFPGAKMTWAICFNFIPNLKLHCNKTRDLGLSKALNPDLLSFEAWLNKYAPGIPLD